MTIANNLTADGAFITWEPMVVPPDELRRTEAIVVLEEWFRWAEEWSMLTRIYGKMRSSSSVLEIGCGLGRIAAGLRLALSEGSYEGFDICKYKIDFLQSVFAPAFPRFSFTWADIENTEYNPGGALAASEYTFPYDDECFDVAIAASVFTHLVPETAARYLAETARVLRPGGRAVFSFFLLDFFDAERRRPTGFDEPIFHVVEPFGAYGPSGRFKVSDVDNPEAISAYAVDLVAKMARDAGLTFDREPLAGRWSGYADNWASTQDVVVLRKEP